jgi:hypothetical protein
MAFLSLFGFSSLQDATSSPERGEVLRHAKHILLKKESGLFVRNLSAIRMVVIMLFQLLGLSLAPASLNDPAKVVTRDGGHQVRMILEKLLQHLLKDTGFVSTGL